MIRYLRETTQLLLRRLDEMSKGGKILVPYNQPSHYHDNEHQTSSDDHTSDDANLSLILFHYLGTLFNTFEIFRYFF